MKEIKCYSCESKRIEWLSYNIYTCTICKMNFCIECTIECVDKSVCFKIYCQSCAKKCSKCNIIIERCNDHIIKIDEKYFCNYCKNE